MVQCSNCNSSDLIRSGTTRYGAVIWKCKNCGKRGTFSGKVGGRPPNFIRNCIICGKPIYAKDLCLNHWASVNQKKLRIRKKLKLKAKK